MKNKYRIIQNVCMCIPIHPIIYTNKSEYYDTYEDAITIGLKKFQENDKYLFLSIVHYHIEMNNHIESLNFSRNYCFI